jgi:hypothetical protein
VLNFRNLETVSPLVDLTICHIVANFEHNPLLEELPIQYRRKVLDKLPPTVSLKVTSNLIHDENYWMKCCKHRWEVCNVAEHSGHWKRMFFEKHIQEMIENFTPTVSDLQKLEEELKLSAPYIVNLKLQQLLTQPLDSLMQQEEDEVKDNLSDVDALKPSQDHVDLGIVMKILHRLQELQVTYGVKNCGMNFDWNLFNFTNDDCIRLGRAVKSSPRLKTLRVICSKVDDKKARTLISHLLDHPSLTSLDLSYNKLSDGAGRGLGKLLNGHSVLHMLNAASNNIGSVGGSSLGHALQVNRTLTHLNLKLNRLGDEGVQLIFKALMKNVTLVYLDLSSNDFGEPSASYLSEMLVANKTLKELIITCNKLGEAGGKLLQEGVEENKTLTVLDLRLTDISAENEYSINQMIRSNADSNKK